MSDYYLEKGIINLKEQFKKDLSEGQYNNFLFFTYTMDPELLEWIPKQSEIFLCINNKVASKIEEVGFSERVKINVIDTHAKIYIMWNDKKIKCWLGSFNFTSRGLSRSIDWVHVFQADLIKPFLIKDILNGKAQFITNNFLLNQIIDFIAKKIHNKENFLSDNLFSNPVCDSILLHNQDTNTLQKSIHKILKNANDKIRITYITPFINKSGLINFGKDFRDRWKDIEFNILTNKPDISFDSDTFLTSSEIEEFSKLFKQFKLFKRKTGERGILLDNETELSRDFLHLKIVHISFLNKQGKQEFHTIFTSANLTKNAWGENSNNLEVGIWLRNQDETSVVDSFINRFEGCFSEPDKDELEEIDRTMEEIKHRDKTTEYWLEDFLKDRIEFNSRGIDIEWEDYLPNISDLKAKIYFKNLVTGKLMSEEIIFKKNKKRDFHAEVTSLTNNKNLVVEYIELILNTNFKPPEKVIKSDYIYEYLSKQEGDFLSLKDDVRPDWDKIIVNGKVYDSENINAKKILQSEGIEYLSLRRCRKSSTRINIHLKIDKQPHLNDSFFAEVKTDIQKIKKFGKVICVSLVLNDNINPPYDAIDFLDPKGRKIGYCGYSKNGSNISYYFRPDVEKKRLTLIVKWPFKRYFKGEFREITLPSIKANNTTNIWDFLQNISLTYDIVGVNLKDQSLNNKFISENSKIKINIPKKLLTKFHKSQIKYLWKEDTIFYSPPKICDVSNRIELTEPYTQVKFRGAIQITQNENKINFFTSENSFFVRKNVVKEFPIQDKQKIPDALPLSVMKNSEPIAWIAVNQDDLLLSEFAENLKEKLHLEVWKNNKKLKIENLNVSRYGKKYLVPIFKKEIGSIVDLTFILMIDSDANFFSNFSWAIKQEKYEIVKWEDKGIIIRQKKWKIPIRDEINSDYSDLYIDLPFCSRYRIEEVSRKYGNIKYVSKNKIFLTPAEDVLICIGPHKI